MRWVVPVLRGFFDYMMSPKLPNVTQLNPLVTRILGQNAGLSTLQGTNSYLVGFPGCPRILIDTTSAGPHLPNYLRILETELRRNRTSSSQSPLAAVLLTHWHPDHSSAVSSVQDLVRTIHTSPDAAPVPVYKCAGGPCLKSLKFYSGPVEPMVEGQTFSIPADSPTRSGTTSPPTLTVLSTPGHTVDHACLLLRANSVPACLFTGDLILGHGSTIVSDLSPYIRSLEKLRSTLSGQQTLPIFPAHGEVVEDGLAKVTEYIQHRQQRIKEAADLLFSQPASTWVRESFLVKRIYPQVPPGLARAATNNLRQSLFWLSSHQSRSGDGGTPERRRICVRSDSHEDSADLQHLREHVQMAVDEFYRCPSGKVAAVVARDWDWMWCEG